MKRPIVTPFHSWLCVALALASTDTAFTQTAADKPGEPVATAEAAKPVAPDADAEKRLQEVLALKFDRSPATVLTAEMKIDTLKFPPNSVEQFRLQMIAGRWKAAGPFLQFLPPGGRSKAYDAILKELDRDPAYGGNIPPGGPEKTIAISPSDIADLADMAPGPPTPDQMKALAALLKRATSANQSLEPLMQRLETGTRWLGGQHPVKRERAADLMMALNKAEESMRLLPAIDMKLDPLPHGLIEKHAKVHFWLSHREQSEEERLEAWRLNEILMTDPKCPEVIKERAWLLMPDHVRYLSDEKQTEIFQHFCAGEPMDAFNALKQVSSQVNKDRAVHGDDLRRRNIAMQNRIIASIPQALEREQPVQIALMQFALLWIDEAAYAKKVFVPARPSQPSEWIVDPSGNMVYGIKTPNAPQQNNPNQNLPKPIGLDSLLGNMPDARWRSLIDPSLKARILALEADLMLKAERDADTLPFIEELAPLDSVEASRLTTEMLRTWATNHSPQKNDNSQQSNPYAQQSNIRAVPLTRAVQARNLEELAAMLKRLRALPVKLERGPLLNAFSRSHSNAEVYQRDSIEKVFGKTADMDPALLAELLETMRSRLAGQWRKSSVQQQAKTQRNDAQIAAEVGRGYEVLLSYLQEALAAEPDNWRPALSLAAATFDRAEFLYSQKVDVKVYNAMREEAFAGFAHAAKLYAAKLPSMPQKEETSRIYKQWLNANLGASDVGQVTRDQDPRPQDIQRIREAIAALPGDAAARHLDDFAKSVSSSIAAIPAHLKPTYLRAALSIAEPSREAEKIRSEVAYYSGLFRELELDARIDGDANVGAGQPFGVFLTLHHTAEIERETPGGFGKYLHNESLGGSYYSYPPVDHRDRLEKSLREKLSERFEIVSITFHEEQVTSYSYGRPGWRETPLAYILLKTKDGAVDRLPQLQLDMDFGDKQGSVVLPVASAVQLLDAKEKPSVRPMTNPEVTEILDERGLAQGKLALEVKVTCSGLPPNFDDLFTVPKSDFKIESVTDGGLAVQRLSSEKPPLTTQVERAWTIKFAYTGEGNATSGTFRFPEPKTSDTKVTFKRYQDVDLIEVPQQLAITGIRLGHPSLLPWAIGGGALALIAGAIVVLRRRPDEKVMRQGGYRLPESITPFTTLKLLRAIQSDQQISLVEKDRTELSETISRIESSYFAPARPDNPPDLSQIARLWLERSNKRLAIL